MTESTGSAPVNALDKFFDGLRRLGVRRRSHDKWLGGVCSGIADRLGVDPVIVRAVTVLLVLLGGVGVSAYLVAWLLLPDEGGSIMAERALRHGEGGAVVLLVVTGFAVFSGFPWWFSHNGVWSFPWGLLLLGGLIWWVVSRSREGQPLVAPRPPAPPTAPGSPVETVAGHDTGTASMASTAAPAPAPPPMGSASRSDQVGQGAAEWGRQAGQDAAAWGQQAGQDAAAWGQQVGTTFVPRPRRRTGGLLMSLIGIGLALVTYGIVKWLGDDLSWAGNHTVIALASALGALGLLVLGLGLAGWRAGFLAFVTVCLAIVTWTSSLLPSDLNVGGRVGNQTWTPAVLTSTSTFGIAAGDAVLDLSRMPAEGTANPTVPVSVGVGNLTIIVPADLTVDVDSHVGAGNISITDGASVTQTSGTDVNTRQVVGTGPTELTLKAGVGIGEIKVVKQ